MQTIEILENARSAKKDAMLLSSAKKNEALNAMAESLIKNTDKILSANKKDVEKAQGIISPVMIDRLLLSEDRIKAMANGVREVAVLPDPVGNVLSQTMRPNA